MNQGLLITGILGVVVGFAGSVFVLTLVHSLWWAPDSELVVPPGVAILVAPNPPLRLLIPSLGIDAFVQYVGVNTKGNMGAPDNYTDVGWYRFGTSPGQIGSAVIDGHVDDGLSLPGVFKNLNEIKKGDDIYVVAKDGSEIDFVVTDIQLYPYNAAPTNPIFNRQDKARLNLITCKGTWVAGEKTFSKRLVVFAQLR